MKESLEKQRQRGVGCIIFQKYFNPLDNLAPYYFFAYLCSGFQNNLFFT